MFATAVVVHKGSPSSVADAALPTYKNEVCQVEYRPGSSIVEHCRAMPMSLVRIQTGTHFHSAGLTKEYIAGFLYSNLYNRNSTTI